MSQKVEKSWAITGVREGRPDYTPTVSPVPSAQMLERYAHFKCYGYRHWVSTRPCNDIYDVVASRHHYVASDRDLYAAISELVTYDRVSGERIAAINIGCANSLDISEDGKRVLYYNHNTGFVEEADVPKLKNITQLFNPGWVTPQAIVKYIPNSSNILAVRHGSLLAEERTRAGAVVDSIATVNPIYSAVMEPDNWLLATYLGLGRDTLSYYDRATKTLQGVIPNLYDGFLNLHVKVPFTTMASDKGPAIVTEYGGVPFNVYRLNTNCLYPILEENLFVGTYYFSIFELPMTPATPTMVTQCYIQRVLEGANKLAVGAEFDISFIRGMRVAVTSDQTLEIETRLPIPLEPYGYSRIYTSSPPEYFITQTLTGRYALITFDFGMWGNVNVRNVGAAAATIKFVGSY